LLKATYDAYIHILGRKQKAALLLNFKFVYYIIKSKRPIEQGKLIN